MQWTEAWNLLKATFKEWKQDDAPRLAAALAYYTTVSIAPILVIAVVVVGFVFDEQTAQLRLVNQTAELVGPQAAIIVQMVIENANRPQVGSIAGIASVLALLWGSTNAFAHLQRSLNRIMDVERDPDLGFMAWIRRRLLSFGLVLAVALLLLISLVLSTLFDGVFQSILPQLPGSSWIWQVGNLAVSFGIISLLFAAVYKVLPDVDMAWSDVWFGALITALLFMIGNSGISFYLANQSAASAFGAAGSLFVFLLWVYFSAQIVFFGAEFTQVYARRHGSGAPPAENAVWMGQKPDSAQESAEKAAQKA